MSFTKKLYKKTAEALPEITARTFSRYCGKSDGYYGSISSQNLEISTNSLLYLAEILQYRNGLAPCRKIQAALNLIANEVARRLQPVETKSHAVRDMIIKAVANAYMERESLYDAPPIIIS